jgi:hypothetical protein
MTVIWHYTTVQKLGLILNRGALLPFAPPRERHEKPAVWFSGKADWDLTANPVVTTTAGRRYATLDETIVIGGGLARIGVAPEVAPHDWKDYKKLSSVSPRRAKAMYDRAVSLGSRPAGWHVTFEKVPRKRWLAVEIWDNGPWVADPQFQDEGQGES